MIEGLYLSQSVKNTAELPDSLPVNGTLHLLAQNVSTVRKGGGSICLLHVPTMISVVIIGRSVQKGIVGNINLQTPKNY